MKDELLLKRCYESWSGLSTFRKQRRRYKAFAYGRQWEGGKSGKGELTNNLIRQLLKSIIGRWLYLRRGGAGKAVTSGDEEGGNLDRDARALEEFLISGCAVQVLERKGREVIARNVSPERLFFGGFNEPDGSDATLIGLLHDMDLHELVRRFSGGDVEKVLTLSGMVSQEVNYFRSGEEIGIDFHRTGRSDKVRVIEAWEKETSLDLLVHDKDLGEYYRLRGNRRIKQLLDGLDCRRRKRGLSGLRISASFTSSMTRTWLSAEGEILGRERGLSSSAIPIVMRLYPYIDCEIHSLVEDVIGQQECVNRLVSLLAGIVDSSAKGVLLFPTDQLPEGFSWSDMRRIWESPGGILPYKRTSKNVAPKQIYSSGSSTGATEMLNLQLKLFDEISGMSAGMRGRGGGNGAEAMRLEMENSTIAMLDLLGSFGMFTSERDRKMELWRG